MPAIDPETVIRPGVTAEGVQSRHEGEPFLAANDSDDHFICDFCAKGVAYQSRPRVGHYMCDDVLNNDSHITRKIKRERPLTSMATYCEDCTAELLLFPCVGFAEARLTFDLGPDQTMKNVSVVDVSQRDDGIPWDPRAVTEKVTQTDFDATALLSDGKVWGPENIVTIFLSAVSDVDIRKLVQPDGSLDPKELGRARKEYETFRQQMRRKGHSRKSFKNHVQGENGPF